MYNGIKEVSEMLPAVFGLVCDVITIVLMVFVAVLLLTYLRRTVQGSPVSQAHKDRATNAIDAAVADTVRTGAKKVAGRTKETIRKVKQK